MGCPAEEVVGFFSDVEIVSLNLYTQVRCAIQERKNNGGVIPEKNVIAIAATERIVFEG